VPEFHYPEFQYVEPIEQKENVFKEIIKLSNDVKNSFSDIENFLVDNSKYFHQFYFTYPLKEEQAIEFMEVMSIKAQEAHRFVPVIAKSKFIKKQHLGFSRQITLKNGTIVQEHVLTWSPPIPSIIMFIEESVTLTNGKTLPGAFAAINQVFIFKDQFYFRGKYFYQDKPTEQQIHEREIMFKKTYENMLDFIEKGNVDKAYNKLKKY
jgi:hypothetical protein